jgi:hypothetical protein
MEELDQYAYILSKIGKSCKADPVILGTDRQYYKSEKL